MIRKKNILIIIISLVVAGLLSYWLYTTYKILFVFLFIPLFLVGPLFRRKKSSQETQDNYSKIERKKEIEYKE